MKYSDINTVTKLDDEHIEIITPIESHVIDLREVTGLRLLSERRAGNKKERAYHYYVIIGLSHSPGFDFSRKYIAENFYNEIRKYYPAKKDSEEVGSDS